MKTKRTKGKWVLKQKTPITIEIISDNKDIISAIANVYSDRRIHKKNSIPLKEAEANAKLIASAPELLENLERIVDRIEENNFEIYMPSALERAKDAIKKATE